MTIAELLQRLYDEIAGIPDERLQEALEFVCALRRSVEDETSRSVNVNVIQFAGTWSDMTDFDKFEAELRHRRHTMFKSRRNNETSTD